MRLLSLELTEFRQFQQARVEFQPGITAIVGANGSGKTTLLEAVAWCLYGASAKRGDNQSLRRMGSAGGSKVRAVLEFELGQRRYLSTRSAEAAEIRDLTDGHPRKLLATGLIETTRYIEKLLAMSLQQFTTSFFTQQKELRFMAYVPERRREEIGRMLGIERIGSSIRDAKDDQRRLEDRLNGLREGLGDPDSIKASLKEAKEAARALAAQAKAAEKEAVLANELLAKSGPLKERAEADAQTHRHLVSEQQRVEHGLNVLRDRLRDAENQQTELEKQTEKLTTIQPQLARYVEIEKQIVELERLQAAEASRSMLLGSIASDEKSVTRLDEQLAELENVDAMFQKATGEMGDAKKRLEDAQRRSHELRSELQSRKAILGATLESRESELARAKKHAENLRALGAKGKCPTCERELGPDFQTAVSKCENEVTRIREERDRTASELKEFDDAPPELRKLIVKEQQAVAAKDAVDVALQEVNTKLSQRNTTQNELRLIERRLAKSRTDLEKLPIGFDENLLEVCRHERDVLRPVHDESLRLQGSKEQLTRVNLTVRELFSSMTKEEATLREVTARIAKLAFDPTAFEATIAEFDRRRNGAQEAQRNLEVFKAKRAACESALESAQAAWDEFERRRAQIVEAEQEHARVRQVGQALAELRDDLNSRLRPDLARYASEFLGRLTEDRYTELEIDEKFQFTLRDDGEFKPVVSGGEEDIVNLSLRLALARMITDRAGQPLSLLVLDEVFGSLDAERRLNVLNVLDNLRGWYEQIFVISHVEGINERADNGIWLAYDPESRTSVLTDQRSPTAGDICGRELDAEIEAQASQEPRALTDLFGGDLSGS